MVTNTELLLPRQDAAVHYKCHNTTVVLFGEVLADIFPDKSVLGGAPFNVACHLKAFNLNPVLISRLGNDLLRDRIMDAMTNAKMETMGIQCNKIYPTGRVEISMNGKDHYFNILPEQAYDYIHPSVARITSLAVNPSFVYFGTLAQRNAISARALKQLLHSTTAPRFLDLNLRAPWFDEQIIEHSLQSANIVKLNDEELNLLTDMLDLHDKDPKCQAETLLCKYNLDQIFVTCGDAGAWHIDRQGNFSKAEISTKIDKVTDTVGAGDGFAAVCLLGLMRRWTTTQTLRHANSFAAQICRIKGAIPSNADFYQPFISQWKLDA